MWVNIKDSINMFSLISFLNIFERHKVMSFINAHLQSYIVGLTHIQVIYMTIIAQRVGNGVELYLG